MFKDHYVKMDPASWNGRVDSSDNRDAFRWHQVVQPLDLLDPDFCQPTTDSEAFCILGFVCDEGVRRNLGRPGAAKAPNTIRRELMNMPVGFGPEVSLLDGGNIVCKDGNLRGAQQALAAAVARILELGIFPIVLGGGHEVALGHYEGLRSHLGQAGCDKTLGIVAFDAHFDLRPNPGAGSSGTMFRQIAEADDNLGLSTRCHYIGIQKTSNTLDLFQRAEARGFDHTLARDLAAAPDDHVPASLEAFLEEVDRVYMTVCADVFSSAFAPGVSATQPFGMHPERVLWLIKYVLGKNKTLSFDIAEVSPRFDDDNQTAKLAAIVVFAIISELT